MDKQRIKGAVQKIKGSVKTTVGRLTGNRSLEAEGEIDNATGSVRTAAGEAKDAVRSSVKPR